MSPFLNPDKTRKIPIKKKKFKKKI